jgi:hypothetical protein
MIRLLNLILQSEGWYPCEHRLYFRCLHFYLKTLEMKLTLYLTATFCLMISSAFFTLSDSRPQTYWKNTPQSKELPRIAIAGLAIESSTFSPALTHEEAFHAKQGNDVFSFYPFLSQTHRTGKGQSGFLH